MELSNEFEVSATIARTWATLTDVEAIAPCLPGAQLQEIDGEEYRGIVKIKVGPISANYKGAASFVEKDDAAHKAVLKAEGRDVRNGNANALITAQLVEVDAGTTKVQVTTDLQITGKVAQFGRGVMADVSAKLMGQFADNLQALISSPVNGTNGSAPATPADETAPAAAAAEAPAAPAPAPPGPRRIEMPEPEPVDLLDAAGAPVLKRLLPVIGIALALLILRRLLRGRS